MRRAELHRAHSDFDASQADYDYVFSLNPKLPLLDLARGRMFLDANWPVSSKTALDRFLTNNPGHPEGLMLRARALVKLNRRLEAAKDYTGSIAKSAEGK